PAPTGGSRPGRPAGAIPAGRCRRRPPRSPPAGRTGASPAVRPAGPRAPTAPPAGRPRPARPRAPAGWRRPTAAAGPAGPRPGAGRSRPVLPVDAPDGAVVRIQLAAVLPDRPCLGLAVQGPEHLAQVGGDVAVLGAGPGALQVIQRLLLAAQAEQHPAH